MATPKKFVRTSVRYTSEDLALQKIDELIAAVKDLCAKLDADTGAASTDYAATISAKLVDTAAQLRRAR